MARTDTYTRVESKFQGMDSAARRDFHSPEAQRFRNEQRKQERMRGEVYDIALTYEPSDNKEEISTATNDTFGNDFFEFEDDGSGGGGGLPDGYEETEVILCQNGSPVDGFILFKLA